MTNYNEQLQKIYNKYKRVVSDEPVDLKTVSEWAIEQGLWHPRPVDMTQSLANDLAKALRDEKRRDKSGREYRANIPIRRKTKEGKSLFEWADIDLAPRSHVEKNIQQERKSIVNNCYSAIMKVDHYNETHPDEEPIQFIMDFEDDIEELKIINGLSGDDAEVA